MFYKSALAAVAVCFALPAFAEITVADAYARSSAAMSTSGAAFMAITNTGEDDRLIGAASDAAERVELHTHLKEANGVMKMVEVKEGFALPAGGTHMLERGADHIMFMGLTAPFEDGKMLKVTLTFEKAAPLVIEVPVDLQRGAPMQGKMPMNGEMPMDGQMKMNGEMAGHDHSTMGN